MEKLHETARVAAYQAQGATRQRLRAVSREDAGKILLTEFQEQGEARVTTHAAIANLSMHQSCRSNRQRGRRTSRRQLVTRKSRERPRSNTYRTLYSIVGQELQRA